MKVPYFRPSITEAEIEAVTACLRSGWLSTGPNARRFEEDFAAAVGAQHAVAVNSCTAALHLAIESLGLGAGEGVLVPSLTFAATAEVVRYLGAQPILVDCRPDTLNLDLDDAQRKIADLRSGRLSGPAAQCQKIVGIIPVHVGGLMLDMRAVAEFAQQHELWVVEDAAHAFPAAWRAGPDSPWQRCGEGTSAVACYSFYANKTITTGEGGMAVTNDAALAGRMRLMSLHGLSHDAWGRYTGGGSWDYRILAAGHKYNLPDIQAAMGVQQLRRADALRSEREALANRYDEALADLAELELPPRSSDRLHSWHLYAVRLNLDRLTVDRNRFLQALSEEGVSFSVHWRPLHLHPLYRDEFGWRSELFPVSTREWERLVSLPLFPGMTDDEHAHVVATVRLLCRRFACDKK